MKLHVSHIAAWAPEVETVEQWREWADGQRSFGEVCKPPVPGVPAITRRRLTFWGRMGLQVAGECVEFVDADTPCVFSSRHGDTARTYGLLENIADSEALSPTAFSLSVHNSSAGIFSIVNKVVAATVAVAGGRDTLANAFIEASGLLSQGAGKVLLVHVDNALADFYQPHADEKEQPHAFAMVITQSDKDSDALIFHNIGQESNQPGSESMGLGFLRFWFGTKSHFRYSSSRASWCFSKEGNGAEMS